MPMPAGYLTTAEVCQRYRITTATLRGWRKRFAHFPEPMVNPDSKRQLLYCEDELDKFDTVTKRETGKNLHRREARFSRNPGYHRDLRIPHAML